MLCKPLLSDDGDRHAKISDAILYYICIDNRPLNAIQCKGFQQLMKELAPHYKIPDKDALKRRLDERYDAMAQVFKRKLCEASHVTITTDVWSETASSAKSYMGVTVHFVTNGGGRKLESGNVEVIELPERAENRIASGLLSTLTKWQIEIGKVVAVVTNDEPSMVGAVARTFGQDRHVACFAHVLNLVAEDSMKKCEGLADIVDRVRSIVRYVKSSVDATGELRQRQIDTGTPENETKKLILDVKDGWCVTFRMMERFVELWNAIDEVLSPSKHGATIATNPECPTADELVALKEIVDLLRPLEFVARECSAEGYIALSKVIPLISCATNEYKRIAQTTALSARLKERVLAELETRFGHVEFARQVSLATILDPRFKIIHFRNAQALANAVYLLRDTVSKSSGRPAGMLPGEPDRPVRGEAKYDLWIHHRLLAHKSTGERGDDVAAAAATTLRDELSLYLDSPLASLKDDPLEKWESMRTLYPSLYGVACEYLSIVATSVRADGLFSEAGVATYRSRNRLTGKRLRKLLFLNSVAREYWGFSE